MITTPTPATEDAEELFIDPLRAQAVAFARHVLPDRTVEELLAVAAFVLDEYVAELVEEPVADEGEDDSYADESVDAAVLGRFAFGVTDLDDDRLYVSPLPRNGSYPGGLSFSVTGDEVGGGGTVYLTGAQVDELAEYLDARRD